MSEQSKKHKFKRLSRFVYIVVHRCEYCGLERWGTKAQGYTYNGSRNDPNHLERMPECKTLIP